MLVAAAAAAGLDVLALTDHDTTGGWSAAGAALPAGMSLVRGAEFSCVAPARDGEKAISVHLLGYLFDPEHPAIVAEQLRLRTERVARLRRMTERMAAAGFPVDVDTVFALLPAGAQRRSAAPGAGAGGRGRRRVGGRGVRDAAPHR